MEEWKKPLEERMKNWNDTLQKEKGYKAKGLPDVDFEKFMRDRGLEQPKKPLLKKKNENPI